MRSILLACALFAAAFFHASCERSESGASSEPQASARAIESAAPVELARASEPPKPAPERRPRLVVLYAPCTVNKDCLSPYDAKIPFTPNLQAFARDAVVFRRHVTEAEQSGPAYASLFSGTHADRHGVYRHPSKLATELYLIGEAFADAGYTTWFWSGHPMASSRLNYGQGAAAERTFQPRVNERGKLTTAEVNGLSANSSAFDALLGLLASDPKREAFVQIDFTLTHGPYSEYTTPEQLAAFCRDHPERAPGLDAEKIAKYSRIYAENHLALQWDYAATVERLGLGEAERRELTLVVRVLYETAVRELDRLFGEFVERIRARGLLDESVIAFTADHGEVLDRESALYRWTHGLQLAPETLGVPFLLHAPAYVRPGAYEQVTRSIDVYPTLAGLCGIAIPDERGVEGVDLSPALRGERARPELLAYSHTTVLGSALLDEMKAFPEVRRFYPRTDVELIWVRIQSGDRVYQLRNLDGERFGMQSFDLATDRDELHDLYDASAPLDREMAEKLVLYKARLVEAYDRDPSERLLPRDEEVERLRSLGYVK